MPFESVKTKSTTSHPQQATGPPSSKKEVSCMANGRDGHVIQLATAGCIHALCI